MVLRSCPVYMGCLSEEVENIWQISIVPRHKQCPGLDVVLAHMGVRLKKFSRLDTRNVHPSISSAQHHVHAARAAGAHLENSPGQAGSLRDLRHLPYHHRPAIRRVSTTPHAGRKILGKETRPPARPPPCLLPPPSFRESSAVFLAAGDSRGSSALPGVRVRSYPTSPTRDDRLEAAETAARARAEQARRIAVKARRDRNIRLAQASPKASPGQQQPDEVKHLCLIDCFRFISIFLSTSS